MVGRGLMALGINVLHSLKKFLLQMHSSSVEGLSWFELFSFPQYGHFPRFEETECVFLNVKKWEGLRFPSSGVMQMFLQWDERVFMQ